MALFNNIFKEYLYLFWGRQKTYLRMCSAVSIIDADASRSLRH